MPTPINVGASLFTYTAEILDMDHAQAIIQYFHECCNINAKELEPRMHPPKPVRAAHIL